MLCLLASAAIAGHQPNLQKVDDLRARLVPIAEPNFLEPKAKVSIKKAIGGAQIVMLGELTHGDGTTFQLKCQLIQFLHDSLGFDALVWESGLYDCQKMNEALKTDQPLTEVARMGVFSHWSRGTESFPVFTYARATVSSTSPLSMTGFDIQPSGSASNGMSAAMLSWFEGRNELTEPARDRINAALNALKEAKQQSQATKIEEANASLIELSFEFKTALDRNPVGLEKHWGSEAAFRRQVINSAAKYAEMMRLWKKSAAGQAPMSASYNLREQGNFENLRWLIRGPYRNKKVIVWAHNVHIFKGLPEVGSGTKQRPSSGQLDSMGRLLGAEFGSKVYSIGVISNGGKWSWLGNPVIDFVVPTANSVEHLFHEAGSPHAFFDLRSLPIGHWLREPTEATINQQSPGVLTTEWPKGFDAWLYIDKMTPRTQMR